MSSRDQFFGLIEPRHLYGMAAVFGLLTALVVVMIYIYLYRKKKRFFIKDRVSAHLDEWIAMALLEDDDIEHTYVTAELIDEMEDEVNRQFVVDLLISTRKNLMGQAANNITRIYEQLELNVDSFNKFRSKVWHIKAKGIHELYMMNQRDMLDEIAGYTNEENEFVRTEAQTAIIGFLGFKGLAFLNDLAYPLTDWQQLKLLEQLHILDPEDMPQLPEWLRSKNEYVVMFALRLAEIYYQLHAHDDVMHCLDSDNEQIRRQAAVTLARLANPATANVLIHQYSSETYANKRNILQQLIKIADDENKDFLEQELNNEDDLLKLESARAIAKGVTGGLELLLQRAEAQSDPYMHIYKHVKQELNR